LADFWTVFKAPPDRFVGAKTYNLTTVLPIFRAARQCPP
jgi:hypothetical protein